MSNNETQIIVDAEVPSVTIIREFDAPPEKVFRAHTERELYAKWVGPRSVSMTIDRFDCVTGGSYRYVHSTEHGDFGFFGSFHVVRPAEEIVQTFTFEGVPEGVALERMTFEALDGGRTRITGVSLVGSFADRDAMVASGMDHGVREGYEKLDEMLASGEI